MVAPAYRTHDHRLCLIRDAFAHEYEKFLNGYQACPTDVFKGACKGIEICDRIVLRALDLEQLDIAAERDRLDHIENTDRLRSEEQGQPGRRSTHGSRWLALVTYMLLCGVVLAIWTFKPGE